ncbi:MAG TPA: response regulator [Planctomycetota bacterium]
MARENARVVVFVDDEREILASFRRLLRNEPYEVRTTTSPRQALDWVDAGEADIVISDQRMPDMLGTSLLELIGLRSPATARVLLTGYPDSTLLLRDLRNRPLLLYKPWDADDLKNTIRDILKRTEVVARKDL